YGPNQKAATHLELPTSSPCSAAANLASGLQGRYTHSLEDPIRLRTLRHPANRSTEAARLESACVHLPTGISRHCDPRMKSMVISSRPSSCCLILSAQGSSRYRAACSSSARAVTSGTSSHQVAPS